MTHAHEHINGHVNANTFLRISRATFELTLMRELDKVNFPIEYKLAWFNAVCMHTYIEGPDGERPFLPQNTLLYMFPQSSQKFIIPVLVGSFTFCFTT